MKKILSILLVFILLGAFGYCAAAWYLGRQVEMAVNEPYEQIASVPYLKIIKREYRRGVFSSQETVTFELFGDMLRFMEQAQKQGAAGKSGTAKAGEPLKPISVTVRSHIMHGPFPDGKTFAAAIVDSELIVDESFQANLAKVLGDKKILTAHTVYRYDGDGESIVTSPAFVTTLPGADADASVQLSWEGVKAKILFTRGFAGYTVQGEAPKLEVAGGQNMRMLIAGMRFAMDNKRIFDDEPLLHAGKQSFTVTRASIDGPAMAGKPVVLNDAAYDVNVSVHGEFIDIVALLGVQDVLIGESNFGPAHYDFSLKRLHARTVAQLNRAMMNIYSNPAALSANANPAAMMEPLSKPVLKLLEYNPEIGLDRISFKSPQGEVTIAARAKFNEVKAEDFKQPPILMSKLDASADISLPEGLLMTPFGAKSESAEALQMQMQMRQSQITALAERGYITRNGTMVRSRLEFKNGQFAVNGKPFDSTVMQAQVPRSSQPPMARKPGKKRPFPAR